MGKGTWANSEREWCLWELKILYKGAVFQIYVFPQASHLALSPTPHTRPVNMSQDPSLGCARTS